MFHLKSNMTRLGNSISVNCAIAILLVGSLYVSTLMWDINGSDSRVADDIGEYQVAMALWGTVHPTGTPLYMLLGSPFVTLLKNFGITTTAGASLFSSLWALGSVVLVIIILFELNVRPYLALLTGISVGMTRSMWVHGSIAEVYSLWMFLLLFVLYMSIKLKCNWSYKIGWLLAFFVGLGCAHHRLFLPVLPVLAVWLWEKLPKGKELIQWLIIAIVFFGLGFLPYVDMIFRFNRGSTWIYGDPGSWDGFWSIFFATEYSGLQGLPTDINEFIAGAYEFFIVIYDEFLLLGIILTIAGICFACSGNQDTRVTLFISVGIAYLIFMLLLPRTKLFEMCAMACVSSFLVVAAVGMNRLCMRIGFFHVLLPTILLVYIVNLFTNNRAFVLDITRDMSGVQVVSELSDLQAPSEAIVMSPWGRRNFALSYATKVINLYPTWDILDHSENWADILVDYPTVFTNVDSIYGFGPVWWKSVLGYQPYINSAGYGWVSISRNPITIEVKHNENLALGKGIYLKGWTILEDSDQLDITLCWQVYDSIDEDYSTFVHIAAVEDIILPEQLLASSDYYGPIHNWHPTSNWTSQEVVCDVHRIVGFSDKEYTHLFAGMYKNLVDGGFNQVGKFVWMYTEDDWRIIIN